MVTVISGSVRLGVLEVGAEAEAETVEAEVETEVEKVEVFPRRSYNAVSNFAVARMCAPLWNGRWSGNR